MMRSLWILLILFWSFGALAATDDFIITTQIGGDDVPPTIPTGLIATPVSTSQIDLSWSPSTDDVSVVGYQVFRDAVQVATTTSPSYSDIGLIASTLYSYNVTAFDGTNNISTSSATSSATTLVPGTGISYGSINPSLDVTNITVISATTSVVIRWVTPSYVRSVVRWGTTPSFELGSILERSFKKVHETTIVGLSPDSLYYFTIEGENNVGEFGILTANTFRTLEGADRTAPSNVLNLRAVRNGDDIMLSWNNPSDVDFSKVRVLRSDLFYPTDTADGGIVTEGVTESVTDEGAAITGTTQYYTVFTYDEKGNISSGAVVALRIGEGTVTIIDPNDELVEDTDTQIVLAISDFAFIQEGEELLIVDGQIEIDGSKNLSILLPYTAVPEHLKSILVTVYSDRTRQEQFSFLLRANAERTFYEASVAPFGVSDFFPFSVTVFDFNTEKIWSASGVFESKIAFMPGEKKGVIAKFIEQIRLTMFLLLLITLLFIAYRIIRGAVNIKPVRIT